MKKRRKIILIVNRLRFILVLSLLYFISMSCISSELRIAEFEFQYKNVDYKIRSAYCPNNPESCNQLMSDKFIAIDINQDRIIDEIVSGNVTLSEAQEVYDYCLNLLENQNKLSQIQRDTKSFTFSNDEFDFEIRTLYVKMNKPLNEFTIIDKRTKVSEYEVSVFTDHQADGILDEWLKGIFQLKEAQLMYVKAIEKGLLDKKLMQINNTIIVK